MKVCVTWICYCNAYFLYMGCQSVFYIEIKNADHMYKNFVYAFNKLKMYAFLFIKNSYEYYCIIEIIRGTAKSRQIIETT